MTKKPFSFFHLIYSYYGLLLTLFLAMGFIYLSAYFFQEKKEKCLQLEKDWHNCFDRLQTSLQIRAKKASVEKTLTLSHNNFLQEELETLPLCAKEQMFLQTLLNSSMSSKDFLQNRYDFLKKENLLRFSKKSLKKPFSLEIYTLSHPVQLEALDLEKLLLIVEGYSKEDPYLDHRPPVFLQKAVLKTQNNHFILDELNLIQCSELL